MRKKKLTEQQLRALEARSRGTNRMEIANSMWNWIRVLGLKDAWDMEAARKKSKGRNLFVSQTYQAYGPMYDISMYNAVHFSTGRLLRACNPWVEENPDGTCTVSWQVNTEGNIAHADDRLRVITMLEGKGSRFIEVEGITATRADGSATFDPRLKSSTTGRMHLYIFFQSADGKAFSPDDHLIVNAGGEIIENGE